MAKTQARRVVPVCVLPCRPNAGLTGWGTALLALAVVFEIGAVALTPSEMEAWVSRTKFGKGRKKKFTSWAEEEAALLALFAPRDKTKTAAADTTHATLA